MELRLEQYKGRIVELIYQDRAGTISQRKVRIVAVEGNYVRAYCLARRAVRSFSKPSILAVLPASTAKISHKLVK